MKNYWDNKVILIALTHQDSYWSLARVIRYHQGMMEDGELDQIRSQNWGFWLNWLSRILAKTGLYKDRDRSPGLAKSSKGLRRAWLRFGHGENLCHLNIENKSLCLESTIRCIPGVKPSSEATYKEGTTVLDTNLDLFLIWAGVWMQNTTSAIFKELRCLYEPGRTSGPATNLPCIKRTQTWLSARNGRGGSSKLKDHKTQSSTFCKVEISCPLCTVPSSGPITQ